MGLCKKVGCYKPQGWSKHHAKIDSKNSIELCEYNYQYKTIHTKISFLVHCNLIKTIWALDIGIETCTSLLHW